MRDSNEHLTCLVHFKIHLSKTICGGAGGWEREGKGLGSLTPEPGGQGGNSLKMTRIIKGHFACSFFSVCLVLSMGTVL